MDLIDRDKLLESMAENGMWQGYEVEAIKSAPTEHIKSDVVKLKGWVITGERLKYVYEYMCPSCGYILHTNNIYSYSFCPNCGARMDGE